MPGCWFGLTVTLALWEAARSGAIARRFIVGGWERGERDDYFWIFMKVYSPSLETAHETPLIVDYALF